jgi:hypothetical protein
MKTQITGGGFRLGDRSLRALVIIIVVSGGLWAQGVSSLPRAWTTYQTVDSIDKDFTDLKAHGIGMVEVRAQTPDNAKQWLANARRYGMKLEIYISNITQSGELVRSLGFSPADAFMIGGVYRGKAIDRHLFQFSPGRHEIIIEPPVYDEAFAYGLSYRWESHVPASNPAGHYFPDIPDPVRAEVVVPIRKFDGKQHLKIITASITLMPSSTKLEEDSVKPGGPASTEISQRKLYRIAFDLTGLGKAQLDSVGIAVYWPYHGSRAFYIFGTGTVSAAAPSTREALRKEVRRTLGLWSEANGGTFPTDVIPVVRFGDECFYITSHLKGSAPAVSYALWDYSEPSIKAYRSHAGSLEYPRTWGYPEVYGPDAYAWWLYSLHEQCAELAVLVREEAAKIAPGILIFRNTTRSGVFAMNNDHDGSGPELLTRNLDIVHLDPYPITGKGYGADIPRDMSYYAGLARRYHRPLIPWMEGRGYGGPNGVQHVTPAEVDRMADEQYRQGVDAVIWLGYGPLWTFPRARPDSWARAAAFHRRLAQTPPPKPHARLAVLRSYREWAVEASTASGIRNPADWMLQQFLEVWAVKHGQPYDVFELRPELSRDDRAALLGELKEYPYIVATVPWSNAWVIGADTDGQTVDPGTDAEVQAQFERELRSHGWLK